MVRSKVSFYASRVELTPADNASADNPPKRAKLIKNPAVDTSFLPDREREEQDRQLREDLRQKWLQDQENIKKEEIEVVYSYWDGSGHRKSVTVIFFFSLLFNGLTRTFHSA